MKNKHIIVEEDFHQKLQELSKKYNTSSKDFAQKMIEFFHRTGHDPENYKIEGSADAIKTLDKRVISFFRKQEKDILLPIRQILDYISLQIAEGDKSEEKMVGHLEQLVNNQKLLNEKFEKILKRGGK